MEKLKIEIEIIAAIPSKKRYLYRAGYKSLQVDNAKLSEKINQIYKLGIELTEPQIDSFYLDAKEAQGIIPSAFHEISSLNLFISTIGNKIDEKIQEFYQEEKPLEAMLLNAWGSESVEQVNRFYDGKLRENHFKGTRRFSPGYGGLPLQANLEIVKRVKSSLVRVNEQGILTPTKSTICMIGWHNEQK